MYSKYLVVGSIFPGIGASDISLLARALHLSSRARTTSAFSLISFHLFLYLPVFVTPPQHSRLSVTDTLIRRTYFAFPSQTIKTFWNQCVSCVQIWSVTAKWQHPQCRHVVSVVVTRRRVERQLDTSSAAATNETDAFRQQSAQLYDDAGKIWLPNMKIDGAQ